MTSIGITELFVIGVFILFSLNIKHLAKAIQFYRRWKNKFYLAKSNLSQQIDSLLTEENNISSLSSYFENKKEARKWGKQTVNSISKTELEEAGGNLLTNLRSSTIYQNARTIGCFYNLPDEINTKIMLAGILEDKKQLFLPFCDQNTLKFCKITDLKQDLTKGSYNILEPNPNKQDDSHPYPLDITLVPGLAFNDDGTRLGRGKGYYDYYLSEYQTTAIGVSFHTQIAKKKLPLQDNDQFMDFLLSEKSIQQVKI